MNRHSQPPDIISRFAHQLSHIVADYLTNPSLGDKRVPLKDRLAVKLMLTLSRTELYREELLFRDYRQESDELWLNYLLPNGEQQKLHTESIYYVQAVLGRRLTIVSQHKALPNNLHILLLMLCRYSVDKAWLRTRIKRQQQQSDCLTDDFFHKMATVLKNQCQQLKTIGAVSRTYRELHGMLYFITEQNRAELPEEISLFDVVEAAPTPLKPAIEQAVWYAPLLERILVSLNSYYGLLRSCGLPPQDWQENISMGHLNELEKLKDTASDYLKTNPKHSRYDAYQWAFLTLQKQKEAKSKKNKKAKLAGFDDFIDFVGSDIGVALLRQEAVSLDDNEGNPIDEIPQFENNPIELIDALTDLLHSNAHRFTPLSAYFFEQVVILQRPLQGINGVVNDDAFFRLIAADKNYCNLQTNEIANQLMQKMKPLIKKYIETC